MDAPNPTPSKLVLPVFIAQVFVNWAYILWVEYQPNIILNSWFVLTPLLGYFYFTFGFIAAVLMHQKKKLGLALGYCVLLFGLVSVVISYFAAYEKNAAINFMIVPLIILNCCVFAYMTLHQSPYQSD